MSTHPLIERDVFPGGPELTALGKRLEILRIERGVSKQRLARGAGTSRQQLWRVMTGKSALTTSLRERLALALEVDPCTLASEHAPATWSLALGGAAGAALTTPSPTVNEYLSTAEHVVGTLRTLPGGDAGRRLKRALLNAIEDLSVDLGRPLPADFSEIRRRVLDGDL